MVFKRAFTLIELLVVIAVIAVLMAILMPALNRAREQGKRAACMSNLKQLTLAWIMYADENDDRLPSSEAGTFRGQFPSAWIHRVWSDDWKSGGHLPENEQLEGIEKGSMWPYVKNVKIYRCPTGYRGELVTYAMVISINGRSINGSPVYKKRMRIPRPTNQLVFLDEGLASPDAYAVRYDEPRWWDQPMVRHGDGTNVSFADGRVAYKKWQGKDTIKHGRSNILSWQGSMQPSTPEGHLDLQWMQKGMYGRLGYTPSKN